MNLRKMISNSKGVSLLELLVGVGLIGGISLAVLKVGETNLKTINKADLDQDVNIINSRIQIILSNKDNCTETLKQTPINSVIQMVERNGTKFPKVILQIKEFNLPADQRKFHSKSGVSIKEMTLSPAQRGEILKVKLAAFKPSDGVYREVSGTEHMREFPIIRNTDGSCYTELSSQDIIRNESKKIACISMNGTYLEATQTCAPTNLPVCIYGDVNGGGCGGSEIYTKLTTFKLLGPGNTVIKMDKCCRLPVPLPALPPLDPPVVDEDDDPDTLPCDQSVYVAEGADGVRCPVCGEPGEPASCPQCGVAGKPACPPAPCGTAGQPACPPDCTPVNGGWSDYSWVDTCPGGNKIGTRTCTNPAPNSCGLTCSGDGTKTESCVCTPVNGGWSDYTWGACVNGKKVGTRTCTNPEPNSCGAKCSGLETTSEDCGECSSGAQEGTCGCGPYIGGSPIWMISGGTVSCCKNGWANVGFGSCRNDTGIFQGSVPPGGTIDY